VPSAELIKHKIRRNDVDHRKGKIWNGRAARVFVLTLVAVAFTGIAFAQDNTDQDNSPTIVRFKGGIGVIPVTGVAATGAVNLNVVRGVNPAGPWRITDLTAEVKSDGHITVRGFGLLLAAGNGIGTNAGASVRASLFCGLAATATEHDTNLAGVALAPNGDFRIDDVLSPLPPTPCDHPVLLIRSTGGVWFAAGIQKL
jgi:hypothetical protein